MPQHNNLLPKLPKQKRKPVAHSIRVRSFSLRKDQLAFPREASSASLSRELPIHQRSIIQRTLQSSVAQAYGGASQSIRALINKSLPPLASRNRELNVSISKSIEPFYDKSRRVSTRLEEGQSISVAMIYDPVQFEDPASQFTFMSSFQTCLDSMNSSMQSISFLLNSQQKKMQSLKSELREMPAKAQQLMELALNQISFRKRVKTLMVGMGIRVTINTAQNLNNQGALHQLREGSDKLAEQTRDGLARLSKMQVTLFGVNLFELRAELARLEGTQPVDKQFQRSSDLEPCI